MLLVCIVLFMSSPVGAKNAGFFPHAWRDSDVVAGVLFLVVHSSAALPRMGYRTPYSTFPGCRGVGAIRQMALLYTQLHDFLRNPGYVFCCFKIVTVTITIFTNSVTNLMMCWLFYAYKVNRSYKLCSVHPGNFDAQWYTGLIFICKFFYYNKNLSFFPKQT